MELHSVCKLASCRWLTHLVLSMKPDRLLCASVVSQDQIEHVELDIFSIWRTAVPVIIIVPIVAFSLFYLLGGQSG